MLPVLLVPFFTLPLAFVSMHSQCQCGSDCSCRGPRRAGPKSIPASWPSVARKMVQVPIPVHTDEAVVQSARLLEEAGLGTPDVPASRLTEDQVQDYVEAADSRGLGKHASTLLLALGVPAEMIFLAGFIVRYRWLFSPTIFDLLPQSWQDAVDRAVGAGDPKSDKEMAKRLLRELGFNEQMASWIVDYIPEKEDMPPAFGFDPSGRRVRAGWDRRAVRRALADEAAQGHVFSSVAPQ
jgi:hypothetical protein